MLAGVGALGHSEHRRFDLVARLAAAVAQGIRMLQAALKRSPRHAVTSSSELRAPATGRAGGPEQAAPRQQYAALPYRREGDSLQILLVSSRETRRWVVPKGWPMKRRDPPDAAAQEALEEAGVKGDVARQPFGAYAYFKRMSDGENVLCRVDVFPLEVTHEGDHWLEQDQRTRRWFAPKAAAAAVAEPELKALIARFAASAPNRRS